jgi:hypothetical protein
MADRHLGQRGVGDGGGQRHARQLAVVLHGAEARDEPGRRKELDLGNQLES